MTMTTATLTSKGQIPVPAAVRAAFGSLALFADPASLARCRAHRPLDCDTSSFDNIALDGDAGGFDDGETQVRIPPELVAATETIASCLRDAKKEKAGTPPLSFSRSLASSLALSQCV